MSHAYHQKGSWRSLEARQKKLCLTISDFCIISTQQDEPMLPQQKATQNQFSRFSDDESLDKRVFRRINVANRHRSLRIRWGFSISWSLPTRNGREASRISGFLAPMADLYLACCCSDPLVFSVSNFVKAAWHWYWLRLGLTCITFRRRLEPNSEDQLRHPIHVRWARSIFSLTEIRQTITFAGIGPFTFPDTSSENGWWYRGTGLRCCTPRPLGPVSRYAPSLKYVKMIVVV